MTTPSSPETQLDSQPHNTPQVYATPPSMLPSTVEEVRNSVAKEAISYVFESCSLSSVVRFIYTPIDGTLADIELEINNSNPIHPAEAGGITIEMGERNWEADAEEVERHFVSCEQVGECVEARWQWKHRDELADVLYRFRVVGKSLIVELEGGNGKATGVDLGRVVGAFHPRLIRVPYFNFGDCDPHILYTSGVFVSSLLDWYGSDASGMFAPTPEESQRQKKINGGCFYLPKSDGKRNPLRERWILTVSRRFEDILPSVPVPQSRPGNPSNELIWYNIPSLTPAEESYVEAYERLLTFKQWGMDHLLVNHPADTWHDGDGDTGLALEGAPAKGGDDALGEYLDALADLGYTFSLYANFRDISSLNPMWDEDVSARGSDGNPAARTNNTYLLKPTRAASLAAGHAAAIAEKFKNQATYVDAHAASPPWDRVDCDSRLVPAAKFLSTLQAEQELLASIAHQGPAFGAGGSHWLYAGLLHGYLARQSGPQPCKNPLLVDFALNHLHPLEADAGLGSVEEFFGSEIPESERHSRSTYLDRYLAATVAFGHAGCLPESETWGLASVVKAYYLLQKLQTYYLGTRVRDIFYHNDGNLLETTDALVSEAYEDSQVQVVYENGLTVHVNGSWEKDWTVEHGQAIYGLPPGSFFAHSTDGLLAYSADPGSGRIDYVHCPEYFYCDTRSSSLDVGPIALNGAALVLQENWKIDIYPLDCAGPIKINISHFWPDRRIPRFRLLAFDHEEEEKEIPNAKTTDKMVEFEQTEGVYKYRITLPEWMVEPGE